MPLPHPVENPADAAGAHVVDARDDPDGVAPQAFVQRLVQRVRHGQVLTLSDSIAEEVPVALLYNGTPHVVMMATPQDLEDFALGFSLSEGLIGGADELHAVTLEFAADAVSVQLQVPEKRHAALLLQGRNLVGRSGCGVCGARDVAQVLRQPGAAIGTGVSIDEAALQRALAQLQQRQSINAVTGATHAAAWASISGEIVLVREDVGRHNALDKLIGGLVRCAADLDDGFLLVTSRASYEMAMKASQVGISLMAAISAPTALALRVAGQANMTLIGFARADGYVVYTHPQRILTLRATPA